MGFVKLSTIYLHVIAHRGSLEMLTLTVQKLYKVIISTIALYETIINKVVKRN